MKNIFTFCFFIFITAFQIQAGENEKSTESSYSIIRTLRAADLKDIKVSLPVLNQKSAPAILLKSPKQSNNWLFIYHDRWGLTETVMQEAYTLWQDLKNVNVLVIDLNDGIQPQSRSQAMRLLIKNDIVRDQSIIQSAINFAGEDAKIGSIGWCNGGSWSLQTAILAREQEVACVVYYGMPDLNVDKLNQIESEVFAIYGTRDTYITPTIAKAFKAKMLAAGKDVVQLSYESKGNFADRNSSQYSFINAADAYGKVLEYLMVSFN
jgi:carboxymethylenebutenolidase